LTPSAFWKPGGYGVQDSDGFNFAILVTPLGVVVQPLTNHDRRSFRNWYFPAPIGVHQVFDLFPAINKKHFLEMGKMRPTGDGEDWLR
jgi:hypothetical protein